MSKKKTDELDAPMEIHAEFVDEPAPATADERKPIEFWRDELGTPEWLFHACRVGKQWPSGQEMTKADYVAGIEWAANITCR